MKIQDQYVVALVTAKDNQQARDIAHGLLQGQLVACVNIMDSIQSFFWWKSRIDEADEVLLIIKTRADVLGEVIEKVKSLHSYETPEIIALPIIGGSQDYLDWIGSSVKSPGKEML